MITIEQYDKTISEKCFWDNPENAQKILKERAAHQDQIETWQRLNKEAKEIKDLLELAMEEGEDSLGDDLNSSINELSEKIREIEIKSLLNNPMDKNNAIIAIHPGAGGTESQDWAEMLMRMYFRWAENSQFKTEIMDILAGDEAGIKSATFSIYGPYAYGYLKSESGVHRLIRISPFDAGKRRHTSFASVFIYPEIDDEITVKIDEADLRIDTFRASGAGGQHVNVTDSAVRITHLPTGITVQCQNERSQHKNKAFAMKVLKARLFELEQRKQAEKLEKIHGQKKEIAWGSQIRSYILQPYRLVKDHRTNLEIGNVDSVLDGYIDPFIEAFLLLKKN